MWRGNRGTTPLSNSAGSGSIKSPMKLHLKAVVGVWEHCDLSSHFLSHSAPERLRGRLELLFTLLPLLSGMTRRQSLPRDEESQHTCSAAWQRPTGSPALTLGPPS